MNRLLQNRTCDLIACCVVLATFAWRALLLVGGSVENGPGDPSVRAMLSNYAANDLFRFAAEISWGIHWPPGQFVLFGIVIKAMPYLGLGHLHYVTIALFLTTVAYCAGQYMTYVIGRAIDPYAGLAALLMFSGVTLAASLSYSLYAESLALPFVLGAVLCLLAPPTSGSKFVLLAAALLLISSLFRLEVAFIAGIMALLVLREHGVRAAFIFITVSCGFTVLRVAVGALSDTVQYLNASDHYSFSQGIETLQALRRSVLPRYMDSYHSTIWLGGVTVALVMLRGNSRIHGLLLCLWFAYTATLVGFMVLGKLPTQYRYFYLSEVTLVFVVVSGFWQLWNSDWLSGRRQLSRAFGVLAIATLLAITFHNLTRVEQTRNARQNLDAIELRRWLSSNVSDTPIFFDFIGYYGAYFRSHTDRYGLVRPSFDYTTYYTRIPRVPKNDFYREESERVRDTSDNRRRTAESMKLEGYAYLSHFRPSHLVVPGDKFYERLKPTFSVLFMLKPYIDVDEASGAAHLAIPRYPELTYDLAMKFESPSFVVYEITKGPYSRN